jgi:3-methyladenine DNA glycosylase AlkD
MMTASDAQKALKAIASPEVAQQSMRFFKTGPGEYGEGDIFIGVRVPVLRRMTAGYRSMPLDEIEKLLHSPIHEERLFALLLMVRLFGEGGPDEKNAVYDLYLDNTRQVNNWDLVDTSAPGIVGAWLQHRDRAVLDRLAESALLWERRIAILATFHFIRHDDFGDTLKISDRLLNDPEDLMHKAVGWMLREVGKRDGLILRSFLAPRYSRMPRTMLRYAIERFQPAERKKYLRGEVQV